MTSVMQAPQSSLLDVEAHSFEYSFRASIPPKRYTPPTKTEQGILASKEKITTESSSDPEFDEGEEDDFQSKQKDEDEEEYTIFTKAVAGSTKLKKNRGPVAKTNNKLSVSAQNKKKKVCEFCGASDTPMWRRGPQGKGTLCNACGVKWSLKFRKKNGNKREGDTNSTDKSKNTRKSSRKERPGIQGRSKRALTGYYEEEMDADQSELFCKSCGISWPSRFFRGSQFGQCNNCSRKQMIMIRSDLPSEKLEMDDDLYLPSRENKRRRGLLDLDYPVSLDTSRTLESDDANEESDDLDADVRSDRLFGSLLNVVENKLVEYQELERIRRDIGEWKDTLLARDEIRRRAVEDLQHKFESQISDLRYQLESRDAELHHKVVDFQKEITAKVKTSLMEATKRSETLLDVVNKTKSQLPQSTGLVNELDEFGARMHDLQTQIKNCSQELVHSLENGMLELKQNAIAQLDNTTSQLSSEIAEVNKQSQEEVDYVKHQMLKMETVFEKSVPITP